MENIQKKHSSFLYHLSQYSGLILKLSLAFILFYFLVHSTQIKFSLFASIFHHPFMLSFTLFLFLLMILLSAQRWHLFNAAQGINLGFFKTVMPTYLGIAFNNLLPGAVGGDFFRTYHLFKKVPDKKSTILISIFLDRLFGFLGLLLAICLVAMTRLNHIQHHPQIFYLVSLFVLFCLTVLAGFVALMVLPQRIGVIGWLGKRFPNKRWAKSIISLLNTMRTYRISNITIFKCLVLSILIQILITMAIMTIAKMMGFPAIALFDYIIAVGITQIVNLIPATPGGIGMGELAFANVLFLLNPNINAAFATIFLGYRLISILVYLPGIVCYIPRIMFLKKKRMQLES